jgi:hypothetical protein
MHSRESLGLSLALVLKNLLDQRFEGDLLLQGERKCRKLESEGLAYAAGCLKNP